MSKNILTIKKKIYVSPSWKHLNLSRGLNLLETLSIEGSIVDFEDGEYDDFE